jgi:hypothetical protein
MFPTIFPANRTLRILLLLVMALATVIFFVVARYRAPGKGAVNGIYYNACCGDVVMKDGVLSYRARSYGYDLENMKFGLTAYVQGRFTEKGIEPSTNQALFLFFSKDGKQGFETMVGRREYVFLKANQQ